MRPQTVVQVSGLLAISIIAMVLALDGVPAWISVLLILSVLAIAAPDAYDRALDYWGPRQP